LVGQKADSDDIADTAVKQFAGPLEEGEHQAVKQSPILSAEEEERQRAEEEGRLTKGLPEAQEE